MKPGSGGAWSGIAPATLALLGSPNATAMSAMSDTDQSKIIAEWAEKLDARPILALQEHHGRETEHRFSPAPIDDPPVIDRIDAFVITWATVTRQSMINRPITEEDCRAWLHAPRIRLRGGLMRHQMSVGR